MSDPKYAYPYPAQGYPQQAGYGQGYPQQPPYVVAPPQYSQGQPQKQTGFLKGCLAALCCCCLLDDCYCDPTDFCDMF
uniref:Cysteine-rich transmembrane domain-containing protein n=1 Tax=Picea sitchensis TaxID=3332 RepID=D5A9A0_PICSI|nr:unknown [Picea sitchensis]